MAKSRLRRYDACLVGIIALQASFAIWQVFTRSSVWDEYAHVYSGLCHWQTEDYSLYRVNPPLVRLIATLPFATLPSAALPSALGDKKCDCILTGPDANFRGEFMGARQWLDRIGADSVAVLRLARLMILPFSLIPTFIIYRWVSEIRGPPEGLLAASLLAFNPMFVGWSATITPDVPSATAGLLACYSLYRYFTIPTIQSAIETGICWGLAMATKSIWVLLPLPVLLSIGWMVVIDRGFRSDFGRRIAEFTISIVLGLIVLNAVYGFQFDWQLLGSYKFHSTGAREAMSSLQSQLPISQYIPIPLPQDFVYGIDMQKVSFELSGASYLDGVVSQRGWWNFQGYVWLYKMPEPLWVVFIVGSIGLFRGLVKGDQGRSTRIAIVVLIPTVLVFATLVSSQHLTSRHGRYSLFLVPLVIVLCCGCLPRQRSCSRCMIALIIASMVIFLSHGPHGIAYFNASSGGTGRGHRHLLDSNLDWGQDLLELQRWREANRDEKQLYCMSRSFPDPVHLGLEAISVGNRAGQEIVLRPGYYAISTELLLGYPKKTRIGDYFAARKSFCTVGSALRLYEVHETLHLAE